MIRPGALAALWLGTGSFARRLAVTALGVACA